MTLPHEHDPSLNMNMDLWICDKCGKETEETPYHLDDLEVCLDCYTESIDDAERRVSDR